MATATATKRKGKRSPPIDIKNLGRWNASRRSMETEAQLLRALAGGTVQMREMGASLLPPDWRELEVPEDYLARLGRTFLFPAYTDALDNISSRPFQKAVKLLNADGLSSNLTQLEKNCDRNGLSLTGFARRLMRTLVDRGICHFIVDNPNLQMTGATAKDGMDFDIRPYFVEVHPDNLVDWAWRKDAGGRNILAYVQLYDELTRTDPKTGDEKVVQRIRMWTESEWQVWERDAMIQMRYLVTDVNGPNLATLAKLAWERAKGEPEGSARAYLWVDGASHSFGAVPIVSININQFGADRLTARPPLADLAWQNVAHWQSSSQQNNILHYGRAPLLQGAGVDQDVVDGTKSVVLGAGAKLFSRSEGFKMSYVEPVGAAITAGEKDLQSIEDKMTRMGLEPLVLAKGGQKTATGVFADEMRTQAKAQAWVEMLEWGLFAGYEMAAKWLAETLPPKFTLSLFRDIGILARSEQDLTALDKANARGSLSDRTLWEAFQERGVLPREFDPDAEEELIAEKQKQQMAEFTAQAEVSAAAKANANPNAPPEAPMKGKAAA